MVIDVKKVFAVDSGAELYGNQVCRLYDTGKIGPMKPLLQGTSKILGLCQGPAGQISKIGTVTLKGVSKNHTLRDVGIFVTGTLYYADKDGYPSSTPSDLYLGFAITNTELFMPDYIIEY